MSKSNAFDRTSLRPGDVLLYYRNSKLGRLIRFLDGTDVSHAALYLGPEVAEAVGAGLLHRSLAESLGNDLRDKIFVHRLRPDPQDLGGVVKTAQALLEHGAGYGFPTIALAGFLALTRKIPLTGKARVLMRLVLDRAAAEILKVTPGASARLVCSELVYRSYVETKRPDGEVFKITVTGAGGGSLEGTGSGTLLDHAQAHWDDPDSASPYEAVGEEQDPEPVSEDDIDRALDGYEREREMEATPAPPGDPIAADPALGRAVRRFARAVLEGTPHESNDGPPPFAAFRGVVASFVSPGDLRRSPSLGSGKGPDWGSLGPLDAGPPAADGQLDLARALEGGDRAAVAAAVAQLVTEIRTSDETLPAERAKQVMQQLRRKRHYAHMVEVGDAIVQQYEIAPPGVAVPSVRRQYAQALIEQGQLSAALAILNALVPECAQDASEDAEVRGLIGRIHKQRFVSLAATGHRDRARVLRLAIASYLEVYRRAPAKHTWHGINVVALARRAERDGLALDPPFAPPLDVEQMAQDIRGTAAGADPDDAWALTTKGEAELALGLYDEALASFKRYTASPLVDAFECASTLRQLREIWQLREGGEKGGALVTLMNVELLRREGSSVSLGSEGLQSVRAGIELDARKLEKLYGNETLNAKWLQLGLDRARAVARVEDRFGKAKGTGFLVRASDLFASPPKELGDEPLFVTNAHVVGKTDAGALAPDCAVVRFDNFVGLERTVGLKELLFESPIDELDTVIARLDARLPGLEPLPLAPPDPPEAGGQGQPRKLFVTGYPGGGPLALSLGGATQVGWEHPRLYYKTPTEPGSSGSPVSDDQWRVVGIHHAGSPTTQPAKGPALVEGNEGIWIHAVRAQLSKISVSVQQGPSVSKAALRQGVFVCYSHEDAVWRDHLQTMLAPLVRDEKVDLWSDQRIQAGDRWFGEIERAIDRARVAVLLVTPSFLSSEFIAREEVPRILAAGRDAGLTIIWVLVSACLYDAVPMLKDIQAANALASPLDGLKPSRRNEALTQIARKIQGAADLSRIKNALNVADQMALVASGLGGTGQRLEDFNVTAQQVSARSGARIDISRRGSGAPLDVIRAEDFASRLDEGELEYIYMLEKAMRNAYDRYLIAYPKQKAADAKKRAAARREVPQLQADICGELNKILAFLGSKGHHLDDHYGHVRAICAARTNS